MGFSLRETPTGAPGGTLLGSAPHEPPHRVSEQRNRGRDGHEEAGRPVSQGRRMPRQEDKVRCRRGGRGVGCGVQGLHVRVRGDWVPEHALPLPVAVTGRALGQPSSTPDRTPGDGNTAPWTCALPSFRKADKSSD